MASHPNKSRALRLYQDGTPMDDIIRDCGMSYQQINYYRKCAGIPVRISDQRPYSNPSQLLRAITLHLKGAPYEKETGISPLVLNNYLTSNDIDPTWTLCAPESDDYHSWPAMPADLETGD